MRESWPCWKRGRVVDCTGLENRRPARVREFESHRFRQNDVSCRLTTSRQSLCNPHEFRARLARVQTGNFCDFKPMQDGVQELRIDPGRGYRVYLSRQGPIVVLLLWGSDKSAQAAAIKRAVAYLKDWRKRGES
jgi:putative addiction module killer protein